MLWFILALVVAFVYAAHYYIQQEELRNWWDFVGPFVFTLMAGIFVATTLCLGFDIALEDKVVSTETARLANLSDGSKTTGSFFLGSGNIRGTQYFGYYAKGADETYTLEQQPASLSKVKFTDGVPYIKTDHVNGGSFWFAPWANKGERYTFFVPRGSIDNHFNLDAE